MEEAYAERESWAIEIFDSWTKLQPGIFSGNIVDLGHYDQCVEFKQSPNVSDIGEIKGKYCMIFYHSSGNFASNGDNNKLNWSNIMYEVEKRKLRLGGGFCLPSSCSNEMFRTYIGNYLSKHNLQITNDYEQSVFCNTNDSAPVDLMDIIMIVISTILFMLLLISTAYEIIMIYREKTPNELFVAFSLYKNGKKLFDTNREKSSSVIHCLPGLRSLSMIQILLGHRYGDSKFMPSYNKNYAAFDGDWNDTPWSAVVNVHPIAVDCFLVIGGCLLARSLLNAIEKKTLNVPKLYLHRYMRVMPVYAYLVLWVFSFHNNVGNGPYFKYGLNIFQLTPCENYWWTSFLHIANYYNSRLVCIRPSWYLNVDFQLVLISPLILYPAYKWGWKFLWLLPMYIFAIIIWSFTESMLFGYKVITALMPSNVYIEARNKFYTATHIRMGPWLIGILLGYLLFKLKDRKLSINKYLNATFWILSLGTLFAILFAMLPLQSTKNPASQLEHAFFFALQRNSWGLAIAWIIFSCHMGSGGIVRKFLELPLWRPLGRMSLSFYLVHTLYINNHMSQTHVPYWFNDAQMLHILAGDILICIVLASILYLVIEEPILLIENYIYKSFAKQPKTYIKPQEQDHKA